MAETQASSPHLSDPERSLEILRAIVLEGVQRNEFPLEAAVRARHDPWLVDDLQRADYVDGSSGRIIPTIAGLRAARTPEADASVAQLEALYDRIKQLYVEDPERRLTAGMLAQSSGLSTPDMGRLLLSLVASGDMLLPAGHDAVGRITQIALTERILERDPFRETPSISPTEGGPLTLAAQDFNVLSRVAWSPAGVCLVVGPNGSGKTTLLQALAFLRDAFQRGITDAVRAHGGPQAFRRIGAEGPEEVILRAAMGVLSWEVRLPVKADSVHELSGEVIKLGGNVLLRRGAYQSDWYLGRKLQWDPLESTCRHASLSIL